MCLPGTGKNELLRRGVTNFPLLSKAHLSEMSREAQIKAAERRSQSPP
jgi:hypothetical protein